MSDEPRITDQHVHACRRKAKNKAPLPIHAAFWAGAVLIDEKWGVTEHDIAQLAQLSFPTVDSLAIARSAPTIAVAVERMQSRRPKRPEPLASREMDCL